MIKTYLKPICFEKLKQTLLENFKTKENPKLILNLIVLILFFYIVMNEISFADKKKKKWELRNQDIPKNKKPNKI